MSKILLLISLFFILSCGGQSPAPNKNTNTSKFESAIPVQVNKSIVEKASELEWESFFPYEIYRASTHRDYTKPEYKQQQKYELFRSFGTFTILNNGTIHTKGSGYHFFSRDHGENWHEFEPFLKDGQKIPSIGIFSIFHTADFFVLQERTLLDDPNTVTSNKEDYRYYISYNGSLWEEASKANFEFNDYVRARESNLLYKMVNPASFEKVNNTRPMGYHAIIYNRKDMSATIYPSYKDPEYSLPKQFHHNPKKRIYKLCDDSFVHYRSNFPNIERGKNLDNLNTLEYLIADSINFVGDKSRINNSQFNEFGCHLSTSITIKNEGGYGAPVFAVLSNNPTTPSKIEIFNIKTLSVFSSPNGKHMYWKTPDNHLSRNKNMLSCSCAH